MQLPVESQNQSVPSLKQVHSFFITISPFADFYHNILLPHGDKNRQYETVNMFQGIEIISGNEHNRRIHKAEMETPFVTINEGIQIMKLYTLDSSVVAAKSKIKTALTELNRVNSKSRLDQEIGEIIALNKCSH